MLRPIDMTITVQRTPELNRSQTGENARPEVAFQQIAEKVNRDTQQQDRQVSQTNKSEGERVDPDGRGSGGGGARGKKKGQEKKDKKTASSNGGSMFDVSI